MLDEMFVDFTRMTKTETADGEGGKVAAWATGGTFEAFTIPDGKMLKTIAGSVRETEAVKICTRKDVSLVSGEIVKDTATNSTYKILYHSSKTPNTANLDLQACTAERWKLT